VAGQIQLSWLPAEAGGCPATYRVDAVGPDGRRVFSTVTDAPEAVATGLYSETKARRGASRRGAVGWGWRMDAG
jgi:hypothetical protein